MKKYGTCKCGHSFKKHTIGVGSYMGDHCMGTPDKSCGCPAYCPKDMDVRDPKYRELKKQLLEKKS